MLKCSLFFKLIKQLVLFAPLLLFACNENGHRQTQKKISDTISEGRNVEPNEKNSKNVPIQNFRNNTDNRVVGKTFARKLSHGCKATTNGAYDIYIFLLLRFDRDSVQVMKQRVDTEVNIIETKKHPWRINGNTVIIDQYGKLQIKKDRLIANEYDGSTVEYLNEELNPFRR